MVHQVNQIVYVCAWLTNFHPALIPPPLTSSENAEVEKYFNTVESESDFVSTDSDQLLFHASILSSCIIMYIINNMVILQFFSLSPVRAILKHGQGKQFQVQHIYCKTVPA